MVEVKMSPALVSAREGEGADTSGKDGMLRPESEKEDFGASATGAAASALAEVLAAIIG